MYMLKSTTISIIFVGYYWIALRNKNFNSFNRFYLLFSTALSLILPILNLDLIQIENISSIDSLKLESSNNFTTSNYITYESTIYQYTLFIFLIISALLLIILLRNIVKIYTIKGKSEKSKIGNIDFIVTNLETAPFTFLNNLFWKDSIKLEEPYGQNIFKHEVTHIKQMHTIDILFFQILCAICWFNPIYWVTKKEIRTIHEFIADEVAFGTNNERDFIEAVLSNHYGKHFLSPTHTFFYSSIKRRIFMLNQNQKTKFSQLRRLFVLPITVCVVISFSIKTIETKATTLPKNYEKSTLEKSTPFGISDTIPKKGTNKVTVQKIEWKKVEGKKLDKATIQKLKANEIKWNKVEGKKIDMNALKKIEGKNIGRTELEGQKIERKTLNGVKIESVKVNGNEVWSEKNGTKIESVTENGKKIWSNKIEGKKIVRNEIEGKNYESNKQRFNDSRKSYEENFKLKAQTN